MEINKKEKDYDPWEGQSFVIASRMVRVSDGTTILDSSDYRQDGEPFKVDNVNQFNLKLAELGNKNKAMRELAIKEGRDYYTQKFIIKL